MASPVEEIKERLDVADVVGSYLKLTRAGKYLKAPCPFHNEKTPSFFVSPERGTFYCFGCGAKGDIFSFVEQFEGLDFPGALALLAQRAGVEVKREHPEARKRRERLYGVLEDAAAIFERNLAGNPKVLEYLRGRGLREETVRAWRVGFAPLAWDDLYTELTGKGYERGEQEEAGLIKESAKAKGEGKERFYDRFRGRIMFPIADRAGRVVAFSGRLFDEKADHGKDAPKYLNSPETSLFNKSRILYGFDKAKQQVRRYNCSIVVEGQMDLLASHQAGFVNTVALSGTALTHEQLDALKRLSHNIVLAFDADEAGIASAGKSARTALSMGMNVKIAALPSGIDPADLVLDDPKKLKAAIRGSKHVVDFYLDMLEGAPYDKRTFRLRVQELVLPFIRTIENKIDQAHFVAKVAERLSIPEEAVWEELKKILKEEIPATVRGDGERTSALERAQAPREGLSRRDVLYRSLLDLLIWQRSLTESTIDIEKLERGLASVAKTHGLEEAPQEESDDALFRAEVLFSETERLEEEGAEMLRLLEKECVRERLVERMLELKQAEASGDEAKVKQLLDECKKLSDELQDFE